MTCPQCGANLRADGTMTSVTCTYCGTQARIQARSRVFQVPQPLPTHLPPAPVVRQPVSKVVFLVPLVVMMAAGASGYVFSRNARRAVEQAVNAGKDRMDWHGDAPVLADADGDGEPDLIGTVRYVLDGDRVHLAAFSPRTGARLWQSEALGTGSTLSQLVLGAAGGLVYLALPDGTLAARDARTGAARWQVQLGEKVDGLCAGDGGAVVVEAADDRWWSVDAAGQRTEAKPLLRLDRSGSKPDDALRRFLALGVEGAPGVCTAIDNLAWSRPVGLLTLDNWSTLPTVDGMYVERLVRRPGGPTVAIGYKSPGTSVPMLAGLDGKRALWTAEIPGHDPLTSSSEDNLIGLSDRAAFALYTPGNGSSATIATAFDLADGRRLWERELAAPRVGSLRVVAVMAVGDVVLISSWNVLQALAQADGAPRFTIGTF